MKGFIQALSIVLICIGMPTKGITQADTLTLETIEIQAQNLRQHSVGSVDQTWDQEQLRKLSANNLGAFLQQQTGIYLKSYGQGSLATSSIRGANAGHTLILWNGLPIQSPMLGQLDLALLPLAASESLTFQKGGNSASWGSGAIGGVLSLDNESNFSNRFNLHSRSETGSFGHYRQEVNLGLGNRRIQSKSKFFYQASDNDYFYFQAPGLPERQQSNARLEQTNFLQDLYLRLSDRDKISFHLWHQNSHREIPPTNVQNRSEAFQEDLSTRLSLDWQHLASDYSWQVKAARFEEKLAYQDPMIRLVSNSQFTTLLTEAHGQWNPYKQHGLSLGSTFTQTQANSAGYLEGPTEERIALFASWKWDTPRLRVQSSLRKEMIDSQPVPLVPVIGMEFQLTQSLLIKGKVSKNYRLPTLNDRFWAPGGDPNLLPESGWSEELSIEKLILKEKFNVKGSLTAFNRNIDNWILWSIREGQNFWSANNITKVWSRGLEARLEAELQYNSWKLRTRAEYSFIKSTNQIALSFPRIAAGDQLIYTPVHQAHINFSIQKDRIFFSYHHRYKGEVQGINDPIAAFQVGALSLQYEMLFKQHKGVLYLNIDNLWDEDYLVIERRPMPGRNYQLGINLYINQKSSK